jgi:hypothetical protein
LHGQYIFIYFRFYLFSIGLKNVPRIFKTSPLPPNIVLTVSMSGTMDQYIMLDYINRILLPATKCKPALLILDEFSAHYTQNVLEQFAANKIEHHLIPGGFTSELQALDVCVNKPLKGHYKQHWSKWFACQTAQVLTDGGNRKKPGYEVVMDWLAACHTTIASLPQMLSRSFATTGLFHRQFGFSNDLVFVAQITGRLKELLFVTDSSVYARDTTLASLLTCNYFTESDLHAAINSYIALYKQSSLDFFSQKAASFAARSHEEVSIL